MIDLNDAGPQTSNITEHPTARKQRVEREAKARIREYVRFLFPRAKFMGKDARVGDMSGDPGFSLSISVSADDSAGRFIDHANHGEKGDLFTLWGRLHGLDAHRDLPRIVEEIDGWLGGAAPAQAKIRHQAEAAKPAEPEPEKTHEITYTYRDKHGRKIAEVSRFKLSNGKKTFLPFTNGKAGMPAPRPLYNLDRWHASSHVVLVEGEKCADALMSIGIDATTLMGGANTTIEKTDLTPLAGKTVITWPDADAPGCLLMERMEGPLRAMGCTVRRVKLPLDKPGGWDAADAIAEGFDVVSFLKEPEEPEPPAHNLSGQWIDEIGYAYEPELIEGLIPAQGVGVIFGPSSAGKSFVTVDWAMRIASGGKVLDRFTEASGVLYFAAEGQGGLRKRLVAARRAHGMDEVVLPFNYLPALLDLSRAETGDVERLCLYAEEVAREMKARGAPLRIVVVDTLAAAAPSADENIQRDMGPIMLAFHRMAYRLGAVILLVAHTGKDVARGLRGWSGIRANADFAIECRVDKDEDTGETTRRSLWLEKAKDGRDGFTLSDYALRVVQMGAKRSGEPDTTCRVEYVTPAPVVAGGHKPTTMYSGAQRRILQMLSEGAKTTIEVAGQLGVDRSNAGKKLRAMERDGAIFSRSDGPRQIWLITGDILPIDY
jgi:5S rRNA maturation endonuclease (ribonuclease M5)/KaiC/GvpD/RAD55 family RecA-like ATPase